MRYLMKVDMSNDAGNANIRDPKFGEKMQALLKEMKAEAAYFTTVNGQSRGLYRSQYGRCLPDSGHG